MNWDYNHSAMKHLAFIHFSSLHFITKGLYPNDTIPLFLFALNLIQYHLHFTDNSI